MNKIIKCASAVILAAVMLCGCSEQKGGNQNNSSASDAGVGQTSVSFPDNVTVSYDTAKSFPESCKIYSAKQKSVTEYDYKSLFGGTPKKETTDYGFELNLSDKHASSTNGNMQFYTDSGTRFDSAVTYFKDNPDSRFMNSEQELSFASKEQAFAEIVKYFEKIGISKEQIEIKNFYSVTKEGYDHFKENLNADAEKADGSDKGKLKEKADWANAIKSEDFYFLNIKFKIDEIPELSDGIISYGSNDEAVFSTTNSIVFTKNGIEYFTLFFYYELTDSGKQVELIGFDKAQKALANKLNSVFTDNKIEIYDAELIYLAVPTANKGGNSSDKGYTVQPYYVFRTRNKFEFESKPYTTETAFYFDATTGKELGAA